MAALSPRGCRTIFFTTRYTTAASSTTVTAASRPVLPEKLLHAAPVLCRRVSCTTPGSSGADCPTSKWDVTHHFKS